MLIESYKNLKHIFDNEDNAINYLIKNNYVNKFDNCDKCSHSMKLNIKKSCVYLGIINVKRHYHHYKELYFSKLRLPLNIQLHVLYLLLGKGPPSFFICSSLQIDKNTMSRYNKLFRKYIKDKQLINPENKIGGRNEIIEIDETKIVKRKYTRGHRVEGAWVIGGIQRSRLKNKITNENKKIFLESIEERNIENINEIIKKYIKKGTFKHIYKPLERDK